MSDRYMREQEAARASYFLRAAAPDMYAALEKAERVLCGWEDAEDCPAERDALAAVRAAIVKARGWE